MVIMKSPILKICAVLFLLKSYNVAGQSEYKLPTDSDSGQITYVGVVEVDSTQSKDDLFTIAKIWFVKTFRASGYVLQMEDKEEGVLIGKAEVPLKYKALAPLPSSARFIFSIYFKDGRYKYEITDFIFQQDGGGLINIPDVAFEYVYLGTNTGLQKFKKKHSTTFSNQLDAQIKALINDLKASLKKGASAVNSDW